MKLAKQALKSMLTCLSADSVRAKELDAEEFLKKRMISEIAHNEVIHDPEIRQKC